MAGTAGRAASAAAERVAARAAVGSVARGAGAVALHLTRVSPRRFARLIRQVRLGLECLVDVARGRYPQMPWRSAAALAGALLYFLAPADVIPDLLPVAGFVDDAAALALVFAACEPDLRDYCAWRGLDPEPYVG